MAKIIHSDWKINHPVDNESIRIALAEPLSHYEKRIKKIGFTGQKKVLDAACGAGHWAVAAARLNEKVFGLDLTEKYLAVAREIKENLRIKNVEFRIGRLEKLPYPDAYFDSVMCYDAWMYARHEQSIKEFARVLKPGGKLYLGCIAGFGLYLGMIAKGFKQSKRFLIADSLRAIKNRVHVFPGEARRLLSKNGFKLIGFGQDGTLGAKNIKIKPSDPLIKYGFVNVYEIIAIKKELNESKHCSTSNWQRRN